MRYRIVILSLLLAAASVVVNAGTVFSVGSANVSTGSTFNLPITISAVSDLYAFQFDVSYDPSVLQALMISEGTFLPSGGLTFFVPGSIDNVGGVASFTADTLIGAISGVSSSGTLALIQFQKISGGTSALTPSNIILLDSQLNDISSTAQSGQVSGSTSVPEVNTIWLLTAGAICLAIKHRIRPVK